MGFFRNPKVYQMRELLKVWGMMTGCELDDDPFQGLNDQMMIREIIIYDDPNRPLREPHWCDCITEIGSMVSIPKEVARMVEVFYEYDHVIKEAYR